MSTLVSQSAPYDGRSIANLILDLSDAQKIAITQLKLLKILYYCNGWYLATQGHRLIKQDFEAWDYGPVIRVVRDAFKSFGKKPITNRAKKLDIFTGDYVPVPTITNNFDVDFISRVFDMYRHLDAWELSNMTHEKGSPWDRIWNSKTPLGKLALRLSEDDIRSHFESLPEKFVVN